MNLEKIISISGKPGLYKLISQSKGGFIVEDLNTGKRTSVSSQNQVSLLDNISIYTYEDDKPLSEIYSKMAKENDGKEGISHKSSEAELQEEARKFVENYDEERVYTSDLKKMFQWYNILANNGLANPSDDDVVATEGEE